MGDVVSAAAALAVTPREGALAALGSLRGRRVLVTGSTGFKGSWLSSWLVGLGADVRGFALPAPAEAPLFGLLRLEARIHQTYGDIRDPTAILGALHEHQPEAVIHLAAQALVRTSYEAPRATFETNVMGGVNLIEAIRATPSVKALVFITSDKCYRNKEWAWAYRENDELGGADPYSASKAAAEIVFQCYQDSFLGKEPGLVAATTRAGNVIGGGDRARDRIVPDCVHAVETGTPIRLRNPNATRPWQHVLEPVSGYLLLAARMLGGERGLAGAWNLAPNVENVRTVREVAERIVARFGAGAVVAAPDAQAPHEAQLLMLSSDKAKTQLGWRPRWDFATAVDRTVDWYRGVAAGEDAVALTERQIAAYVITPVPA